MRAVSPEPHSNKKTIDFAGRERSQAGAEDRSLRQRAIRENAGGSDRPLTPERIFQLQQTIGNRGVGQLLKSQTSAERPIQRQPSGRNPSSAGHSSPLRNPSSPPIQMNKKGAAAGLLGGVGMGAGLGYLLALSNPVTALAALGLGVGGALLGHAMTRTPKIPKLMHFVWLGGKVPSARIENILSWVEAAEGVTVNLWLDDNAADATGGDLGQLESGGVAIRNISELYGESERLEEAAGQLPTVDDKGVNPGAAGALSDIVRLEILHKEGGTYMDSDNTPGDNAGEFADMDAPLGVRLGWAKLEHSEAFSNDAISAVPGNEYIANYREHVYGKMQDKESRDAIVSRDSKKVKNSVMNTTGPEAMAEVPLPFSSKQIGKVNQELDQPTNQRENAPKLKDFTGQETMESINIADFGRNKEGYRGMTDQNSFSPKMGELFNELAYPSGAFHRASDNAWVPKEE